MENTVEITQFHYFLVSTSGISNFILIDKMTHFFLQSENAIQASGVVCGTLWIKFLLICMQSQLFYCVTMITSMSGLKFWILYNSRGQWEVIFLVKTREMLGFSSVIFFLQSPSPQYQCCGCSWKIIRYNNGGRTDYPHHNGYFETLFKLVYLSHLSWKLLSSVRQSVCKLFTFSPSSKPLGQF